MRPAPEVDILSAIESSVAERPDLNISADTPIDIPEKRARVGDGDGLALDLARSEAMEEDVSTFAPESPAEEPPVEEPPSNDVPLDQSEQQTGSITAQQEVVNPRTGPHPQEGRVAEPGADVRRRLLQRALRNVGSGPFQPRPEATQSVVRESEAPAAAPSDEVIDAELERDLADRARKAATHDHFATLDLQRSATTEQVKEAFLSLAKKYHPDRLSSQGQTHLLPQARDVFAQVKDAYDVLLDPATRARHITELDAKSGGGRKLTRDDAKGAYQRALVYLKRKDLKQAEAELVRAVDADPAPEYQAELAWVLLSNPSRREESRDEVKSLIGKALKAINPSDRVYVVAAHVARGEGDLARMEKHFMSALERNPKNVEAARELRLIEMRRPTQKPSGLLDRFRKKP
jgi:tetratricopeptide (TPR) repeat protein